MKAKDQKKLNSKSKSNIKAGGIPPPAMNHNQQKPKKMKTRVKAG